jgi:hypothetical protein
MAEQVVRRGSSCPLIGPEPALGLSARIAREMVMGWMNRKHADYWQSGQKQAKGFLKIPSAKRAQELLSLSTNQMRVITGLLTGHCHLKGHLFKLRLVNSPKCDRCKWASEMASHMLCHCEALATLRFRHLDQHFMKQVTLRTSLSARYCTLFKVNEYKGCIKNQLWSKYTNAPALLVFCSVLFYLFNGV